jgi:hypothetical protein
MAMIRAISAFLINDKLMVSHQYLHSREQFRAKVIQAGGVV